MTAARDDQGGAVINHTANELVQGEITLVTLPAVYLKLKALLDSPEYSMRDIGDLMAQDPAITARLLRLVNSAYFGVSVPIDRVSKAVNLLGTQQVHDLVLATSVMDAFKGSGGGVLNLAEFWLRSVRCGVIARSMATRCNILDTERMFVVGLLREIGHLILYRREPDLALRARDRARDGRELLFRIEREEIGCDYAQIGAELMAAWQLPTSLELTVRHHTVPSRADEFQLEAAILHIAALVVELGDWGTGASWIDYADPLAVQVTGLTAVDVTGLLPAADVEVGSVAGLFLGDARKAS